MAIPLVMDSTTMRILFMKAGSVSILSVDILVVAKSDVERLTDGMIAPIKLIHQTAQSC
jgi:hypothetical protein